MTAERPLDNMITHALKDDDQQKCLWHNQYKRMRYFINIREAELSKLFFPNKTSLRDDFVAHPAGYFRTLMKGMTCEKMTQLTLRSHTSESFFFEKGKN